MENNFFVGSIYHSAGSFSKGSITKEVLLSLGNDLFASLDEEKIYPIGTCDETKGDFVINGTLIPTSSREYNKDYEYLAQKFLIVKNSQSANGSLNKRRVKNKNS